MDGNDKLDFIITEISNAILDHKVNVMKHRQLLSKKDFVSWLITEEIKVVNAHFNALVDQMGRYDIHIQFLKHTGPYIFGRLPSDDDVDKTLEFLKYLTTKSDCKGKPKSVKIEVQDG